MPHIKLQLVDGQIMKALTERVGMSETYTLKGNSSLPKEFDSVKPI